MSALPPKADIGTQHRNVRFVPLAEVRSRRYAGVRDGGTPVCADRLTSEGVAP
jgi:hypothetical protein